MGGGVLLATDSGLKRRRAAGRARRAGTDASRSAHGRGANQPPYWRRSRRTRGTPGPSPHTFPSRCSPSCGGPTRWPPGRHEEREQRGGDGAHQQHAIARASGCTGDQLSGPSPSPAASRPSREAELILEELVELVIAEAAVGEDGRRSGCPGHCRERLTAPTRLADLLRHPPPLCHRARPLCLRLERAELPLRNEGISQGHPGG
jgi:hypothetical protein